MSPLSRRGFLALSAGAAVTAAAATGAVVARPRSADSAIPAGRRERTRVLEWFRSLPNRAERRVVSGQHITADVQDSYPRYIERLAERTGQHVALVGVDYALTAIADANEVLAEHWSAGGLVTLDLHLPNPWQEDEGEEGSSRVARPRAPKPDLRQLLREAPASSPRSRWRDQVDRIADGLADLRDRGVVVLLRPLHEANGNWFWWAHDEVRGTTASVELYRDLHDELSSVRGLDNLLWMYSPAPSWDAPVMRYYPGDEHVDLIGPSRYDDGMRFYGDGPGERDHPDRAELSQLDKPIGWGECGPDTFRDGSWDTRTLVDRIRTDYRNLTFFQCWHSWPDNRVALVDNEHAGELLADPWVITRRHVDWWI